MPTPTSRARCSIRPTRGGMRSMAMVQRRTAMATSTRDTTRSDAVVAGLLAAAIGTSLIVYAALFAEPSWQYAQAAPRYAEVQRGKMPTVVELDALTQALRASPARADLSRAAFVQMLTAQRVGLT